MGVKHPVIYIDHEDGEGVYIWDLKEGMETISSCLTTHPHEHITVGVKMMTEKQYDRLPDYDGDC